MSGPLCDWGAVSVICSLHRELKAGLLRGKGVVSGLTRKVLAKTERLKESPGCFNSFLPCTFCRCHIVNKVPVEILHRVK